MLKHHLSDKGVLTLTLSAPPANTLSEAMLDAMSAAFGDLPESARVVVLAATGRIFSAGHDLKEMTARRGDKDRGRGYFADIMARCAGMMQAIVACPLPVIAKVDGLATAAGCQLVATCDLAIASRDARFCTPGVNIGLFCSTPMVALSRNVSPKRAMEMLLLGDEIDADTAMAFGLVNRVVDVEDLDQATSAMAEMIASKSSHVLKIGKQAFYQQAEMTLEDAYDHCAAVMVDNMLARDAEEGLGAVLEKRAPVWEDR